MNAVHNGGHDMACSKLLQSLREAHQERGALLSCTEKATSAGTAIQAACWSSACAGAANQNRCRCHGCWRAISFTGAAGAGFMMA